MKKNNYNDRMCNQYANHGITEAEGVKKHGNHVTSRDWVVFDTIEEAMDFFNSQPSEFPETGYGMPAWMIHAARAT